jgi:hypothetical protein
MMGFALGPTAAAVISELAGYNTVIAGAGVILAGGLIAIIVARRMAPTNTDFHGARRAEV